MNRTRSYSLFCSPHRQDSPLVSFHQPDRTGGRFPGAWIPTNKGWSSLRQRLRNRVRLPAVPYRFVADLLSIPTGDRYPQLTLTPEKRKEKTLEALLDAFREPCRAAAFVAGDRGCPLGRSNFSRAHRSDRRTRAALASSGHRHLPTRIRVALGGSSPNDFDYFRPTDVPSHGRLIAGVTARQAFAERDHRTRSSSVPTGYRCSSRS